MVCVSPAKAARPWASSARKRASSPASVPGSTVTPRASTSPCHPSSATPMPNALSTPASGWESTVRIPSRRATAQACCPPAPPKTTSA